MSILDTAVEKIGEAMGVVASTTEKAVNVGKKKYNIAALNNKLDKCYLALGKTYYEKIKDDDSIDAEIKEKLNEIKEIISSIEIAEKELEELK